jgi:hypothetical protein
MSQKFNNKQRDSKIRLEKRKDQPEIISKNMYFYFLNRN